jgi:1-deoxy-D-xylulose-5-phosphate synthase
MQNLPVKLCMDRGGLVGDDGYTHHGVFDYAFLIPLPNMTVMAPKDENELRHMLLTAIEYNDGPISMRYPRGSGVGADISEPLHTLPIGKAEIIKEGDDLTIWAIGSMVAEAEKTAALLKEKGIHAGVVNMRFAKPLDEDLLTQDAAKTHRIVTMEEGVVKGGVGEAVLEALNRHGLLQTTSILTLGIPDEFISQGDKKLLMHDIGLSPEQMAEQIAQWMQKC